MNAKNKKAVVPVVITLLVLSTITYFAFFRKKKLTKAQKVTALLTDPNAASGSNYESLMSFQDGYIDAWYTAAKKGDMTFGFENKIYKTSTGKLAV